MSLLSQMAIRNGKNKNRATAMLRVKDAKKVAKLNKNLVAARKVRGVRKLR